MALNVITKHQNCFLIVLAKNWRFAPNFDSSCGGQARFARKIVRFAHNMAARPFFWGGGLSVF